MNVGQHVASKPPQQQQLSEQGLSKSRLSTKADIAFEMNSQCTCARTARVYGVPVQRENAHLREVDIWHCTMVRSRESAKRRNDLVIVRHLFLSGTSVHEIATEIELSFNFVRKWFQNV